MNTLRRKSVIHHIEPGHELKPLGKAVVFEGVPYVRDYTKGHTLPMRRKPRTEAEQMKSVYGFRRLAAGLMAVVSLGGVYEAAKYELVTKDCTFSLDTKPVFLENGQGIEHIARQVNHIVDGSYACVPEAIDAISELNKDVAHANNGTFLAGVTLKVPESVHIKNLGDLFRG